MTGVQTCASSDLESNDATTTPSQGVAYGFTDDSDTGLVKDSGGNPAIQKDGVVVASSF